MNTTYDFIDSNKRKTFFLIALFPLSLAVMTYASLFIYIYIHSSSQSQNPISAVSVLQNINVYFLYVFAIIIVLSSIWTLISFYSGHNFILSSVNSRQANQETDREIIRLVENIAITAGLPMPQVYIMDTPALNAFATGRNPENAYVVLTTGIIEKLEKPELEGVIAHEMSHIGNSDTKLMMIIILVIGFFTLVGSLLMRVSFSGRRGRNKGALIFLIVGLILYIYGTLIAPIIRLAVSRRREYQADATAALITRNPQGLISALKKISSNPRVDSFEGKEIMSAMCIESPLKEGINVFDSLHGLFSTHPPVAERIKALEQMDGIETD